MPEIPQHEYRRQRHALFGVLLVGALAFVAQDAGAGIDGLGNTTVSSTPSVCADPPCTSPDGGTDWACMEKPGATLRISAGKVSNMNYRTTLDPDGGWVATTGDAALFATEIDQGRTIPPNRATVTLTPTDGGPALIGVPVLIHLDAADAYAGVSHCP